MIEIMGLHDFRQLHINWKRFLYHRVHHHKLYKPKPYSYQKDIARAIMKTGE